MKTSHQFLILHMECPKYVENGLHPEFEDLTHPRAPEVKLDHEFGVFKCQLCGLEISVHWKEPQ